MIYTAFSPIVTRLQNIDNLARYMQHYISKAHNKSK